MAALHEAGIEAAIDRDLPRVRLPASEAEKVPRALTRRRLYPTELRPEEVSLETVSSRSPASPADANRRPEERSDRPANATGGVVGGQACWCWRLAFCRSHPSDHRAYTKNSTAPL